MLVKTGTLHVGDYVVVGETMGRVKAMLNEHGKRIKTRRTVGAGGDPGPAVRCPKAGETLSRS